MNTAITYRNTWLRTWHVADCAANEALRAVALRSRLARDHMGEPPSEGERRYADGLREVADALLQQAAAARRSGTATVLTSPRLGYDEMWSLALHAGSRRESVTRPPCPA